MGYDIPQAEREQYAEASSSGQDEQPADELTELIRQQGDRLIEQTKRVTAAACGLRQAQQAAGKAKDAMAGLQQAAADLHEAGVQFETAIADCIKPPVKKKVLG